MSAEVVADSPADAKVVCRLRRWWWIKLKALTENRDWEQLEAFAKSKKSPIGYEPFVVSGSMIAPRIRQAPAMNQNIFFYSVS